jgi:Rrf2 family protein
MELSNKGEYALIAMLTLANQYGGGDLLQIRQIAAQQHIPDRYLDQLLGELRQGGLIKSERGVQGGYRLAREPWKITVLEVIRCIEGLKWQRTKGKGADTVSQGVVSEIFQARTEAAHAVLQQYTLQDLLEKQAARQHEKLMYYI